MASVTGVIPALARSWLLISAARSDVHEVLERCAADQVILDLEDAIPDDARAEVRRRLAGGLAALSGCWLRINPHESTDWDRDVALAAASEHILGVMLAKCESAASVEETHRATGGKPVIPLIESALGVELAVEIARAEGVLRLAFGSGDYRHDTSTASSVLGAAYPRSRLVVASAAAGLPGPIDGPVVAGHPDAAADAASAIELGMRGRLCLAPADAAGINDAFTPSAADVQQARSILELADAADGSYLPRRRRALRVLELARIYDAG